MCLRVVKVLVFGLTVSPSSVAVSPVGVLSLSVVFLLVAVIPLFVVILQVVFTASSVIVLLIIVRPSISSSPWLALSLGMCVISAFALAVLFVTMSLFVVTVVVTWWALELKGLIPSTWVKWSQSYAIRPVIPGENMLSVVRWRCHFVRFPITILVLGQHILDA